MDYGTQSFFGCTNLFKRLLHLHVPPKSIKMTILSVKRLPSPIYKKNQIYTNPLQRLLFLPILESLILKITMLKNTISNSHICMILITKNAFNFIYE